MKQFAIFAGIDKPVFFTLVSRLWNVAAGLVTLGMIAHYLSPELQGYYYTFNSLIALQIFAELGLNFAIVQFASHEMAHLTWQTDGTVSGSPQAKRRLQSILQFSLTWFGFAALILVALLVPIGLFFFSDGKAETNASKNVNVSWVLLVFFTSTNLFVSTSAAILEGCGKVAQVAMMRLCQSVITATVVWLILGFEGGLLAIPASSFAMVLAGISWLWVYHRSFFKDLLSHRTKLQGMGWRSEIWPFQWRIALSWSSGFFLFQIFNPILFKTVGPVAAGQMGMTMQIFSALNGAAMAWISSKAPIYGQLITTGQRKQLDALFARGLLQSTVFLLSGLAVIWEILYYTSIFIPQFAQRFLPLSLFSVLCFVSLANHIVFAEASYLRAHKEEPFMVMSLFCGLITLIMALVLIPMTGLNGAVASYALPALLIGLGWGSLIFFNKRRYWTMKAHRS